MKKIAVSLLSSIIAISPNVTAQKRVTADELKKLFFNQDYEGCVQKGTKAAAKSSDVQLKAWLISCKASDYRYMGESVKDAEALKKSDPDSEWADFALAQTQLMSRNSKKALESIDAALKKSPLNEEFILTKTSILQLRRNYAEAVKFLEDNADKVTDKSRYKVALALANHALATTLDDAQKAEKTKQVLNLLAESVKLAPDSVNANYHYAATLVKEKKYAEAIPVARKLTALSPPSIESRKLLWKAISGREDVADSVKKAELNTEIESYLKLTKNSPESLLTVIRQYSGENKDQERRKFYEDEIIGKYPNTEYDEQVILDRIFREEGAVYEKFNRGKILELETKDEAKMTPGEKKYLETYKKEKEVARRKTKLALREFVKRKIFDKSQRDRVYYNLFKTEVSDAQSSDEDLMKSINLLKSQPQGAEDDFAMESDIAFNLFENRKKRPNSKITAEIIEDYARRGVAAIEKNAAAIEKNRPGASASAKIYSYGTLGKILTANKKYTEAEIIFDKAQKSLNSMSQDSSMREFYEEGLVSDIGYLNIALKNFDKAEELFDKFAKDNDNTKKKFAALYEAKNGKKEGFDDYYAKIRIKIIEKQRERVVASRIKNPAPLKPFSLPTIEGKTVAFDDFKGKVLVINAWGTWCSPCVAEMPEMQQLYDKYKDDKEVAIITMDMNDTLDAVKKFIAEKKYTFPVLFADSYSENVKEGFPTTFFVDKKGNISFYKVGNTGSLVEEFSWRIDALKADQ